jgi:hypothetical protein
MCASTHVQGHGGLLKVDLALAAVDQALADVLHADAADEVTHLQTNREETSIQM